MTDGNALLAAILANPDEDTPRLVYADWLQENGQDERAEFIRVQCERARTVSDCGAHLARNGNWLCRSMGCGYCPLMRREFDLWLSLPLKSVQDMVLCVPIGFAYRLEHGPAVEAPFAVAARGFLHSFTCTAADWLTHCDAILAQHPITQVTLTTEPDLSVVGVRYPGSVFVSLPGRTHRDYATDDDGWQPVTLRLLSAEWPRIKFTLPDVSRQEFDDMTADILNRAMR